MFKCRRGNVLFNSEKCVVLGQGSAPEINVEAELNSIGPEMYSFECVSF